MSCAYVSLSAGRQLSRPDLSKRSKKDIRCHRPTQSVGTSRHHDESQCEEIILGRGEQATARSLLSCSDLRRSQDDRMPFGSIKTRDYADYLHLTVHSQLLRMVLKGMLGPITSVPAGGRLCWGLKLSICRKSTQPDNKGRSAARSVRLFD